MGALFARELARDGLTLPMYRVLAVLTEQGVPQRLGELASLTSIEISTLSRLVADMQRRGYVARVRPEADQRSLAISLTQAGTVLATRLIPRAAHYERRAVGDLTQKETAALKTMLSLVYRNLDELESEVSEADKTLRKGTEHAASFALGGTPRPRMRSYP